MISHLRFLQVLLVEDNASDEELTLHTLQKHNISNRAPVVRGSAEALGFLFGPNPHAGPPPATKVILHDRKLPKVDRLEVLRRLKSGSRTWAIPVVVLTFSREERDVVESHTMA